jgi:Protein of unknown function (DUF3604)
VSGRRYSATAVQTIRPGDGDWIGRCELTPGRPVVAGSIVGWRVRYEAGRYGVDDGGALKLSWRFASDWSEPQLTDPAAPSYLSVETDASAVLTARYEPRGNVRPWMKTILLRVADGFVAPGQSISLSLVRSRAQTFCETRFQLRLFVDCFGADVYEEVEEELSFPIVSGPAARLFVVAPSRAVVGQPTWAHVRAEDAWGNPAADYRGTVALTCHREGALSAAAAPADGPALSQAERSLPAPVSRSFTVADAGAGRLEGPLFDRTGLAILRATDAAAGLAAESNPIEVAPAEPALRPFWGDLHGQSGETIGTNTVEDYFRFARDQAGIDFCCHQGNDFQVTPAVWEEIRRQTRAFHAPGRFVTFLGVEWSAITAAGGDHNVIYAGDDGELHRSSHWQVDQRDDLATDAYPVAELYRAFAGRDVILLPHIGGRRADLRWHDPTLEPLIEIHSCWGTFEWFLEEALARGYRVGFTAGSDDHKGRPGAAGPGAGQFGVRGGLTCLYARELSRPALWEALRARRTSCSTGARIVARLRADGRWMGEEYRPDAPPTFAGFVAGTDGIEEVQIRRGAEVVHRQAPPYQPGDRVRVAWTGARILDRNRQQLWDGRLRVDGTRLLDARDYAIDTPTEGIERWDGESVDWRSRTAGDEDGLILRLSDPGAGTLHFETDLVRFDLPLAALERERAYPAGGIGRRVTVTRLSEAPAPRSVELTWREAELRPGWQPYYLRVKQVDGALAWTSPIYVKPRE